MIKKILFSVLALAVFAMADANVHAQAVVNTLTVDMVNNEVVITGTGATGGGDVTVVITSTHTPPLHPPSGGQVTANPNGTFTGAIPIPAGSTFTGGTETAGVVDDTSGNGSTSVWGVSPAGVGHMIMQTILPNWF